MLLELTTAWFYILKFDDMEMVKFLLKYDLCMPNEDLLGVGCSSQEMKIFLLSVKKLENLQGNDFINAYKTLSPEVQEIQDVRVSRYRLSKLAEFIEEKFSKESTIGYKEYFVLREYSSLTKHKKEILKTYLARKNFNSDELIKVDNYIKAHFFEIACIGKNLAGSTFENVSTIILITQYLQFEDSSIKIAGVSSENNTDGDHS